LEYVEYITLAGVVATLLGIFVTWLLAKKQFEAKKLTYSYDIEKLVKNDDPDLSRDLKVLYRDEELQEPTLMTLEIANTGRRAVENAEIVVQLPGTTYLIPGHFVDLPAGYLHLWNIERTDAEECTVKLKHINPRQTVKMRFLMDEMPQGEPQLSCPMPNVEFNRASAATMGVLAEIIVSVVAPQVSGIMRLRWPRDLH
jgi:hypothetical protein